MTKVKVKVTNRFKDIKNELVIREIGEILEVSKSRANVLIENDVAEEIIEEVSDVEKTTE